MSDTLTSQQLEMLTELAEGGPLSTFALAQQLRRSESTTREALRRLQRRGLVTFTTVNGGHGHLRRWMTTDEGDEAADNGDGGEHEPAV